MSDKIQNSMQNESSVSFFFTQSIEGLDSKAMCRRHWSLAEGLQTIIKSVLDQLSAKLVSEECLFLQLLGICAILQEVLHLCAMGPLLYPYVSCQLNLSIRNNNLVQTMLTFHSYSKFLSPTQNYQ